MSSYLLDTNVLSELLRIRQEPTVVETLRAIDSRDLATSSICVTELRFGAMRHPQGADLWRRISKEVLPLVRILPIAEPEAERAGDLLADLAGRGLPIGIEDVLIAATAHVGGMTVVTRNLRHFERIESLRVESWWP